MGRKRTSKKEKALISVDKDLLERLRELEVNRSLLFTKAAEKCIEEIDKKEQIRKKTEE